MSTPCSLEHCHTNLFALQSLNDMKWKCFRRAINYRPESNQARIDQYKDPILVAYWHHLRNDTLCAWRRVPTDDGQKTEKELWLFGINEDLPSELPNLRPVTNANGSWNETAMSYECRSMLFKALHNMIEKYFLSKGFARLNKWFVLPVNDHSDLKVPNFSFNFNFFLHGDNKVCASVDVQRHRLIYNLTKNDLERTSPSNVILAPYGISGMLVGHVNRDIDMNILRENWERNYPVRHLDGLPDFVEVTAGNIRMFYPTCYVYKIGTSDETLINNENNKKPENSTKKSKISTSSGVSTAAIAVNSSPTTTSAQLDLIPNNSKNECSMAKKLANNLMISAQRNNCLDLEKKQENQRTAPICPAIADPMNRRQCRCHQCVPMNNRNALPSTFIPFHRRPRVTPPASSSSSADPSIRPKIEPIQNPSDTIDGNNALSQSDTLLPTSSSSPAVTVPTTNSQQPPSEKPADWTASTPNGGGGPPSVLAPITNLNSVPTASPVPAAGTPAPVVVPTPPRGLKRSATMAFDDLSSSQFEDEEREQQKQTYDFHRTDSFLQLPLKRFRHDSTSIVQSVLATSSSSSLPMLTTSDHVYRHGQPTPPSPSHTLRDPYAFDDEEDAITRAAYPSSTHTVAPSPTNSIRQQQQQQLLPPQQQFYITDGPSMADLETIIDSQDTTDNVSTTNKSNTTVLAHILSNGGVKSPIRKENMLAPPPPPPPPLPPLPTTNGTYPVNKSLNGVFHEMEQIYNTPPGSSSSDKLQALHSPYAIMVDSVNAATSFDMLNQFSQESIIAPFESVTVEEQSAYFPLKKLSSAITTNSFLSKPTKRYESAKSFSISTNFVSTSSSSSYSTHHKTMRHWRRPITNDLSSPLNHQHPRQQQQQQHTPRSADIRSVSMPTNAGTPLGSTMYSPMNNTSIRSVGGVDLQSSPFANRSVGSVTAMNSPTAASVASSYSFATTVAMSPEVDSLFFNVLLNDSVLNLFRDMNFDSCVLCACTPNELNIRGADAIIYLEKQREINKPTLPQQPPPPPPPPQPYHSHHHMYPHQQSPYHLSPHHHPHAAMYAQQQATLPILPTTTTTTSNNLQHTNTSTSNNNSCSCGFSAVVNLRLGCSSGLFYEDEIEITGIKTEVKYRTSLDRLPVHLLELIERKECLSSPFDYFHHWNGILSTIINRKNDNEILPNMFKQPVYQYENWACRLAIEQSRNGGGGLVVDDLDKHHWLHQWSYSNSPLDSDQQLIGMLRSLQPLLVEALKKRNVSGLWNTIDGPLTWKSFHQLLYVQNQHVQLEEQISGPQPIPYVLAGLDREWVMLAPYGLKFWDKLCLEPYSKAKDIAYVCVVPDNDYICSMTKIYFRELSTHYELCRLGTHRPLLKAFVDQGLLRISSSSLSQQQSTDSSTTTVTPSLPPVDKWFTDNETTHPLGVRLKHYAQTLKGQLYNVLSQPFDASLIEESASRRDIFRTPNDVSSSNTPSSSLDLHGSNSDLTNSGYALSPSSSAVGLMANNIYTTGSAVSDALSLSASSASSLANGTLVNGHQLDPIDVHAFDTFHQGRASNDDQLFVVLYIIDTFRYDNIVSNNHENGTETNGNTTGTDDTMDAYVKKAIFRAYLDLIKELPEKISIRVNIQIVPFESIVSQQIEADAELRVTQLKRLAFHVYGELRRTVSYNTRAKSLTGFGPAASEEKMPAKIVMQLYTPAYILSPKSDFRFKAFADITEQTNVNGSVLFCSYCLSDDQRYLLATCSDDRGEMLETCSINIEVPDRHRRKVQHARRVGLQKLWDFIMRIVTSTTMPWRIVIGRLGRLGHGELKGWGIILSKKNLVRCATLIRDKCSMCHTLRCHDQPVILSACLISMETHPSLTVLPESLELGEIRGTQAPNNNASGMQTGGQVLDDVSVTHILTLPTSASVQHLQTMPRPNDPRQSTGDPDDDLFSEFFQLDAEGPPNDAFDTIASPPPIDLDLPNNTYGLDSSRNGAGGSGGYHNRLGNSSTNQNDYGGHPYGHSNNGTNPKSGPEAHFDFDVDMNDTPTLHQQPLALGFYVSTIGTLNPLPIWMLHGKYNQRTNNSCSVFKATLHVSVPNAQHSDDMLFAQSNDQKLAHPLDSNYTYVVLRHVLESYNRLSWLLIDAKTNERASCLPIHIETLLRLYHAFVKFV